MILHRNLINFLQFSTFSFFEENIWSIFSKVETKVFYEMFKVMRFFSPKVENSLVKKVSEPSEC